MVREDFPGKPVFNGDWEESEDERWFQAENSMNTNIIPGTKRIPVDEM